MAAKENFEKMSYDQLVDISLTLHEKIEMLREERREVKQHIDRLIERERMQDAIKAAGLEGKVIIPEPAVVNAEGH